MKLTSQNYIMNKPSILILIPVWKRPDVYRITLAGMLHFITATQKNVKIQALVVLSPEDPCFNENHDTTRYYKEFYDLESIFYKNDPVGEKHNAGLNYALQEFRFDYLMNFGSDDLIHPAIIDLYMPYIRCKTPFFGINNVYFWDPVSRRCIFYHAYNDERAIGAGRMIRRSILNFLQYKRVNLWDNSRNRSLDGSSRRRIIEHAGVEETVISAGEFPYLVDIKSDVNITSMDHLTQNREKFREMSEDYLYHTFPILR